MLKLIAFLLTLGLLTWSCNAPNNPGQSSKTEDGPPTVSAEDLEAWKNIEVKDIALDEDQEGEVSMARNLYVIFDGSGSMNASGEEGCAGTKQFQTKLEGARWAIQSFLGGVPDDVNLGLYVFDNNGEGERLALGPGQKQRFMEEVSAVTAGGRTPLADGIRRGTDALVEQYRKQLGYGDFRLVVITDGLAEEIPAAAMTAAGMGMPIYAIGLCIGADHPLRHFSVSYRAADNFNELAEGLTETLAELPNFDPDSFQ